MLKLTSIIILCGLFCPLATAQMKLTREEDELKGPVRTVQTVTSRLQKDGTGTKYVETSSSVEAASYDRQGRKTEQYKGYRKDEPSNTGKTFFVYDEKGRLQEVVSYEDGGKVGDKFIPGYDEEGRLISLAGPGTFAMLDGSSPVEITTRWLYTVKGKTVEMTVAPVDKQIPSPLMKTISTYARNGRLIDEKAYLFGSYVSHQKYSYDLQGRLTTMNEIMPKDHTSAQELYSYDKRGNVVEIRRYSGRKRLLERKTLNVYELDSAGNWVKTSTSGWVYTGKGPYQEGVSMIVPYAVKRRVITYYEQLSPRA